MTSTDHPNQCLGEHEKVVVFLKESTTVFEKSAKVIVDFSQQLVEIFGVRQTAPFFPPFFLKLQA